MAYLKQFENIILKIIPQQSLKLFNPENTTDQYFVPNQKKKLTELKKRYCRLSKT